MTDWQTSGVKLQLHSVSKRPPGKKMFEKKNMYKEKKNKNTGVWVVWKRKGEGGGLNQGSERTKKTNLYLIRGMWGPPWGIRKLWKIKGDGFKLSNFHIKQTPGSMLVERLPHIQHTASEKGTPPAHLSLLILPPASSSPPRVHPCSRHVSFLFVF